MSDAEKKKYQEQKKKWLKGPDKQAKIPKRKQAFGVDYGERGE
jgi:hypothetical protein